MIKGVKLTACMQLSKPEGKGKAYEAALGAGGGVPTLEAALKTMGAGELAALELEDFEVAGKQRVMVLDVTRARLVRCSNLATSPFTPFFQSILDVLDHRVIHPMLPLFVASDE